jgi:hypothetical protein
MDSRSDTVGTGQYDVVLALPGILDNRTSSILAGWSFNDVDLSVGLEVILVSVPY